MARRRRKLDVHRMGIGYVAEIDMTKLADEIETFIRRRIRRERLIKTGAMLQSIDAKVKHYMNVKGQPWDITVDAIHYYKYQDKGTVMLAARNLTPTAKDIKKMIQKLVKIKREKRRRPRF